MELLVDCGCEAGEIFGALTDAEVYRLVLARDVQPFVTLTRTLAESLTRHGITRVITDAWEQYNPSHDLCRVMTQFATALMPQPAALLEYAVTAFRPLNEAAHVLELDEEMMMRKMRAADLYDELREEVRTTVEREGIDTLRFEGLYDAMPLTLPEQKPAYEVYGERRVQSGRYHDVLRQNEHFAPFIESLAAALGVPSPLVAIETGVR